MREIRAEALNLSEFVRLGDLVMWGHGTSEPLTLTESLLAQRHAIGAFRAFVGVTYSSTLKAEFADTVSFASYGALGGVQALHAAGALEVMPGHLSLVPDLIESGRLTPDVVLMQLSAPDGTGRYSPGLSHDYLAVAARRARTVIVEVNDQIPWTHCDEAFEGLRMDVVVHTSRAPLEVPAGDPSPVEQEIGQRVAALIPDRAVLQTGIGALPAAILRSLNHHRDLGLHSGMAGDTVVDLIEAGVITNAHKSIDPGVSICGLLTGTQRLYGHVHQNPAFGLRPLRYTHAAEVLARVDRLHALNSAVEVDLTGQVNAEMVGPRYVGAVGGQVDFVRGAQRSRDGRAITALPSTAAGGRVSRIVPQLSQGVVTTARSDADVFVTEWGVADLRGQTLRERARRMMAIAHPDHRESLAQAAHALGLGLN